MEVSNTLAEYSFKKNNLNKLMPKSMCFPRYLQKRLNRLRNIVKVKLQYLQIMLSLTTDYGVDIN